MASRIWITCDHEHLGPHLTRELPTAISNEGWCQGGRVLDPGSFVLIEKYGSIWPKRANDALLHWATTDRSVTPDDLWDALAGGEQP